MIHIAGCSIGIHCLVLAEVLPEEGAGREFTIFSRFVVFKRIFNNNVRKSSPRASLSCTAL